MELLGALGTVSALRPVSRPAGEDLSRVAEATGAIYGAACSGRWPEALATCEALIGSPVRLVMRRGRRWATVATASRGPSRFLSSTEIDAESARLVWDKPLPSPVLQLAEVLESHVVKALELARSVRRQLDRAAAASAALDRIPFGVVLIDAAGRVARANRTALEMLAEVPEVGIVEEGLAVPGELRSELSRVIARAVAGSVDVGSKLAGSLEIPGPDGLPLRILAVPLQKDVVATTGCALFLSRPGTGFEPPEDVLARHYSLTKAEARVLARLLRGLERNEIAEELGVGRETVRSHVKSIYAKIGTTRQADLVAELLRGPAGLRWD